MIYDFRFLRRDHLSFLTDRPAKRLHRRLFKLVSLGYLTSIRLPQQKHIYALGRAAIPVLVDLGIAEPNLAVKRIRTHELKELFLKHEMLIVDVHVALTIAAGATHFVTWREGRELWDSVSFADRQSQTRLPFRPDALFSIIDRRRDGQVERNFFLEADRSSEIHPVFTRKLLAYWHYHEQQLHAKKFDIDTFRVLTVTVSQARADNLCRMTAAIPTSILPERARKFFYYTSLDRLGDGAHVFDAVYRSAQAPSLDRPIIPTSVQP